MNHLGKKLLTKAAGAVARGPLKRLLDRRAAKGGKLVTWWRETFGELDHEQGAEAVEELAKAIEERKKK